MLAIAPKLTSLEPILMASTAADAWSIFACAPPLAVVKCDVGVEVAVVTALVVVVVAVMVVVEVVIVATIVTAARVVRPAAVVMVVETPVVVIDDAVHKLCGTATVVPMRFWTSALHIMPKRCEGAESCHKPSNN